MARTKATLPEGFRVVNHITIAALVCVFPRGAVESALAHCGRASRRRRELPADVAVYLVIAMGLFRYYPAPEVLRCLVDGLRAIDGEKGLGIPNPSAISLARARLGTEPFDELRRTHVRALADPQAKRGWFRGMRLMAVDGATLGMPNERANREEFGARATGDGAPAFPGARLVTLTEVGTYAMLAWQFGPRDTPDARLVEGLLPDLSKGTLVLADYRFLGSPLWGRAAASGADLLWRVEDETECPVLEGYPDGSYRSVLRAIDFSHRKDQGDLSVRVIEYEPRGVHIPRRLVTTLSPAQAPAAELAALYHGYRETGAPTGEVTAGLLTPGPGASTILRSKTPDLVRQEIHGLMLAHYAIRASARGFGLMKDDDPASATRAVRVLRRRTRN